MNTNLSIVRAFSPELLSAVYELRYRAYLREGVIPSSKEPRFSDHYDTQPNQITWAILDGSQVVGSIRSMWRDPQASTWSIPEFDCYQEFLSADLSHQRILSGNRLVIEEKHSDQRLEILMLLLRAHMCVAEQRADYALAAVRKNHIPFYQRVLQLDPISLPKPYPGLQCEMVLLACNFHQHIDAVYQGTPQIKPTGSERFFFDHLKQSLWESGLTTVISQ